MFMPICYMLSGCKKIKLFVIEIILCSGSCALEDEMIRGNIIPWYSNDPAADISFPTLPLEIISIMHTNDWKCIANQFYRDSLQNSCW